MLHRVMRMVVVVVRRARLRASLVLGFLAFAVLVVGPVAMMREAQLTHTPFTIDEAIYFTLGLFAFASNPLGYPQTTLLRLVFFLAPALSASALFEAFVSIVEERSNLFIGRMRGHAIVGGLGNLGVTLVSYLERQHLPLVAIERKEETPAVAEMRAAGASVVVVGDVTSAETLRRARAPWASRLFFVSQSDVTNLDAAFQVRRLVEVEGLKHAPTIFAHVYDTALGDALEGQLTARHDHDVRIIPFNSYRFAAKALIGDLLRERLLHTLHIGDGLELRRTRWPDDAPGTALEKHAHSVLDEDRGRLLRAFRLGRADPTSGARDRFAVVGMGRFGRSVIRELLSATGRETHFLVVERSEAAYRASTDHFSEDELARFDPVFGDATATTTIDRIAAFAPAAVIVCTDSDISNLRLSVDLRRHGLRAVTRMSGPETSIALGRGLDERGITIVGLSRLFRAAIPILTHERRLLGCLNLDVNRTPEVDHLFYLSVVTPAERQRLGPGCVGLEDLPRDEGVGAPPEGMVAVWHRAVKELAD